MTTTKTKTTYARLGAVMLTGMAVSSDAHANNFSNISNNIGASIGDIPGLMSALSYLVGVLLGILGVLKIKDHVENPSQTPLKDGAVRLAVGGALFALPILFESMFETVGSQGQTTDVAKLNKATLKF